MTIKKVTSIELLNSLKQLRLLNERINLPVEAFNVIEKAILNEIDQSEEIIERRLAGLKAEDDFLLMCMVLGTMDNIIPLPQKKYLDKEYTIPDFLISIKKENEENNIKNYETILVETKKMKENQKEYAVSLNYMEKLKEYALMMDRPLFFAIKANLVDINFLPWMLIPSTFIEEKGKIKKIRLHGGRNEKCFVIDVLEMFSNDYSGLWFHNYNIMVPKGYQYIRKYSKSVKTFMMRDNFGYITNIMVKNGNFIKTAHYGEHIEDNRDLVFYELCGFLGNGPEKIIEEGDVTTSIVEMEHSYLISYYHLIIQTYLRLRKEFYSAVDGIALDDLSYYIDNFSIVDQNIVNYIKDILFELEKLNLIMIIRMIPNTI